MNGGARVVLILAAVAAVGYFVLARGGVSSSYADYAPSDYVPSSQPSYGGGGSGGGWAPWFLNRPHPPLRYIQRNRDGHRQVYR